MNKTIALMEISSGKRSRETPPTRWSDDIKGWPAIGFKQYRTESGKAKKRIWKHKGWASDRKFDQCGKYSS